MARIKSDPWDTKESSHGKWNNQITQTQNTITSMTKVSRGVLGYGSVGRGIGKTLPPYVSDSELSCKTRRRNMVQSISVMAPIAGPAKVDSKTNKTLYPIKLT